MGMGWGDGERDDENVLIKILQKFVPSEQYLKNALGFNSLNFY